jgi:lipoate-protein ligase A
MIVNWYPFEEQDGAANMAADEVMLLDAVEGRASLRVYSWSEATASLGYFQPYDKRPQGLPCVRRSTGGGTIIHHHDLTYALALPPGVEWKADEPWSCKMHHLLQQVLREDGVETEAVVCGREMKLGEALCFQDQTAGDLRLKGHKVAGSAQRQYRGALLQHGSVLLAQSLHAPELPGLLELTGRIWAAQPLGERWLTSLIQDRGWSPRKVAFSPDQLHKRREIQAEKYAHPEWTQKR